MRYPRKDYDDLDRKINRVFGQRHGNYADQYYTAPTFSSASTNGVLEEMAIGRGSCRRARNMGGAK